jgi:hypothetical protein
LYSYILIPQIWILSIALSFIFKTQDFRYWTLSSGGTYSDGPPEEGDRIQSLRSCVLNKRQDDE